MPGNHFGDTFRISSFGESHGLALGVIIDGCPAGLEVDGDFLQRELARRRPGQSAIVTQRKEADAAEVLSGGVRGPDNRHPDRHRDPQRRSAFAGLRAHQTSVSPLTRRLHLRRQVRPPRLPGWGPEFRAGDGCPRGGGAFAKTLLATAGVEVLAFVERVGDVALAEWPAHIDAAVVEGNPVRAATAATAVAMEARIREVRKAGDTIGGVVGCRITGVPAGWGEPVFDKLHADLGKGMLSINACKGFEYGSGFAGTQWLGSRHNDAFVRDGQTVRTTTNHSGGVQGGISNGMPIEFRCAFKPVATIMQDQASVDADGKEAVVTGKGRHDPCVLPRAVPIVEAMAALVLADHMLRSRTSRV